MKIRKLREKAVREARMKQTTSYRNDRRFLGHPLGLGTISGMTLCQGFANYGMSSVLIYFLYATAAEGGLGFSKANAAQFISLYSTLSFLCGILGSYLADRLMGIRKAIRIGYFIKTLGYALLAIPGGGVVMYLGSQFLLLMSAVSMGSSLDALTGKLYEKGDDRRDGGYSILYIMNNVGAVAPVITGTIAQMMGYRVGFLFAAVLQGIGFVLYILTEKKLFGDTGMTPDDEAPADETKKLIGRLTAGIAVLAVVVAIIFKVGVFTPTSFANTVSTIAIFIPIIYLIFIAKSDKTTAQDGKKLKMFFALFLCNSLAMMVWNQSTGILAVYADERVNLNFFGFQLTPAAFQTVPAVYAVVLGIIVSTLWLKLGKRQPDAPMKFGLGTMLWGAGPMFMIIPFLLFSPSEKVSPMWLLIFYLFIILGEAITSPTGPSCTVAIAPRAFTVQMFTIWKLSQSTGAGLSTLAVNFYKEGSEAAYFLGIGLVTCLIGLAVCIMHKKIASEMQLEEETK